MPDSALQTQRPALRFATVSPELRIGDPMGNAKTALGQIQAAHAQGAAVVAFPELSLTGYTAEDLFGTSALRTATREALAWLKDQTKDIDVLVVVGAPLLASNGRLYNAAVVMHRGVILGAVPKSYLPNYKEFYEQRWFQPGFDAHLTIQDDRLGTFVLSRRQLFDLGGARLAIEICEDVWSPLPPSRLAAMAGADIVLNLSASNETIGKAAFRRDMLRELSQHHALAYVYVSSGPTESTKDLVFGGHSIFADRGALVAESPRFVLGTQLTLGDIELREREGRPTIESVATTFQTVPLTAPLSRVSARVRPEASPAATDAAVGGEAKRTPAREESRDDKGPDWAELGYARIAVADFAHRVHLGDVTARGTSLLVLQSKVRLSDHLRAELTKLATEQRVPVLLREAGSTILFTEKGEEVVPEVTGATGPTEPLRHYQKGRLRFAAVTARELDAAIPAPTWHALAGANVVVAFGPRLTVRSRLYLEQLSARLNLGLLYVVEGADRDGATSFAAENGNVILAGFGELSFATLDLEKLDHERIQNRTFGVSPSYPVDLRRLGIAPAFHSLERYYGKLPFVPLDTGERDARSEEIIRQQATGLARRILASGSQKISLGLSGGSDSTLSLLVTLEACRLLDWKPAEHVVLVTMPGFGTTSRTKGQAERLARSTGIPLLERDIRALALETLRAQSHPIWNVIKDRPFRGRWGWYYRLARRVPDEVYYPLLAEHRELQDVLFENAQARQRTVLLMQHGFVVGTGDMSELALGWATYNADHMSMYNPNASIPKTLVKHLLRWYAEKRAEPGLKQALLDVVDTQVSPELTSPGADGSIVQSTEATVGPYILHDFFLFHYVRNGFSIRRIYELACQEFANGQEGVDKFTRGEIRGWIKVFFKRFFTQQFKRSVVPGGPKVGSVSLSPRGDWRMPDEASIDQELEPIDSWP